MTKLTLFFHIMLVIITALLCLDVRKKDKIQFILCLGTMICWIALTVNEAIYLFG